jgi:antitoxin component YwqK of YwqJK toxin-antitoxin module
MRLAPFAIACALAAAWHPHANTVVKKWYADGTLAEVREYSGGVKTGLHRGWWPNGAKRFECRFENGRSAGSCREWYRNGRLATIHRFRGGIEAGLQQGWSDTGAPQFSYEIRDGRRYGLLGSMTCKTAARAAGAL